MGGMKKPSDYEAISATVRSGAACAMRSRTRSNKSFLTASYARLNALKNANSSAEPWLLKTKPRKPKRAAPL